MKTVSQLTDYYYKTLYPILEELEKQREALKSKVIVIGTITTLIVAALALFLLSQNASVDMLLFLGFAYFAIGAIVYKWMIKDYAHDFKDTIISPLITEIDANLRYSQNLHIDESYFTRSRICTTRPDRVRGNDYVHGKIDGVNIQFSDFHAEKKHTDNKGRTTWSTLFQGLFIVADFPKNFKGSTVILPDVAQSSFGNLIGNFLQSNNFGRNELIKMDNVAFEKAFVVYGTDQIESRYILTPSLMQKLLSFKRRSKQNLSISFIGGNIYMAIEYNKDLFEPSVFHSLLKYKIAMEYIETLHLAIGIVEELKLNEKLWSKL